MRNDEIVMVPVSEIIANATHSVDFGAAPDDPDHKALWWERIIRSKSSDTGFGALVNAILNNGFDPNSPIGWYGGYEITEGHHRLVAAILLGLDEIPTTPYGGGGYGDNVLCAHNCACNGEADYIMGTFDL